MAKIELDQYTPPGRGAQPRPVKGKLAEVKSVLDFIDPSRHQAIIDGTSSFDCTEAITNAFAAHDSIDFGPEGWLFNVSQIAVPAGKSLVTRGRGPTFQQIAGQASTTPVILMASNTRLGNCKIKGNISTDTGEFMHAVQCFAGQYGVTNVQNVRIGDIYAENIRGDGILIGALTGSGYVCRDIHVGDVTFDNVLRNGVSIVTAQGVDIASIVPVGSKRCGYMSFDIESDATSGPTTGVRVGYIRGRVAGVIGAAVADYADAVEIGVMEMNSSYWADSSPAYAPGASLRDALVLRNVKSLKIGKFICEGDYRQGANIGITYSLGELGCQSLEIGYARLRQGGDLDGTRSAMIFGANIGSNALTIEHLDIQVGASGISGIEQWHNVRVGRVTGTLAAGSHLLNGCPFSKVGRVALTGGNGFLLLSSTFCQVEGGEFNGEALCGFGSYNTFTNMAITTSTYVFDGANQDNTIERSVVNGTARDYYNPAREATTTYDPGSLADATGVTTTLTLTGAALGDLVVASFSLDLQGITMTAWVSAANTVSVRFQNESGGVVDLASGTLKARLLR